MAMAGHIYICGSDKVPPRLKRTLVLADLTNVQVGKCHREESDTQMDDVADKVGKSLSVQE